MKKIAALLFIFCWKTTIAQIVNIEKARMQSDTTGWLGNAGASFSLVKNTQKIFSSDVDAHLQYKSKKSLYLILGSYGFLKGAGTRFIDNTFFHFRYNYKLNKLIRWEAFTQLQKNVITKIRSRYLLGTGPRFKLVSNARLHLYAATLIMYEQEKESGTANIIHQDARNSNYISVTLIPNKQLELVSTVFFQPLLKNVKDFRILHQASLKVKAAKNLAIRINWNYLNDSYPVAGIPSVNYSFNTGFEYDF